MINENRISQIVSEEIMKEEINKSDEKRIKEIVGDCINELFKQLWQKNSFWKSTIMNA